MESRFPRPIIQFLGSFCILKWAIHDQGISPRDEDHFFPTSLRRFKRYPSATKPLDHRRDHHDRLTAPISHDSLAPREERRGNKSKAIGVHKVAVSLPRVVSLPLFTASCLDELANRAWKRRG